MKTSIIRQMFRHTVAAATIVCATTLLAAEEDETGTEAPEVVARKALKAHAKFDNLSPVKPYAVKNGTEVTLKAQLFYWDYYNGPRKPAPLRKIPLEVIFYIEGKEVGRAFANSPANTKGGVSLKVRYTHGHKVPANGARVVWRVNLAKNPFFEGGNQCGDFIVEP